MTETGVIVRNVLVEGHVLGVGYREFIRRAALRLNVSGWVRNRPDGAVEALICGPPAALLKRSSPKCVRGPQFATVNSVSVDRNSTKLPATTAARSLFGRRRSAEAAQTAPLPINSVAATCRAWKLRLRPFGAAGGRRRVGRRIAGGKGFLQLLVKLLLRL